MAKSNVVQLTDPFESKNPKEALAEQLLTDLRDLYKHFDLQSQERTYVTSDGEERSVKPTDGQIQFNSNMMNKLKKMANLVNAMK